MTDEVAKNRSKIANVLREWVFSTFGLYAVLTFIGTVGLVTLINRGSEILHANVTNDIHYLIEQGTPAQCEKNVAGNVTCLNYAFCDLKKTDSMTIVYDGHTREQLAKMTFNGNELKSYSIHRSLLGEMSDFCLGKQSQ